MKERMKTNVPYESPCVEVLSVMVEAGYDASVSGGAFGDDGVVITPPVS